ncbi:MAG: MATE family efflux transporter [Candidatus Caccosoma sp.]|nr:MATE family efflux transporter [Candidatus Caccosoma sp.]
MSQTKTELDLTKGNLFTKFFIFVMPLMLTTILQLLYTTVDLWTVSNFGGGSLSMTAIGSNSALINLIITVLVSLSTGSSVCISVAKGSNNQERANKILHTSILLAIIGGIFIGIFGFFMAPVFLNLMDTPTSIINNATNYLKIYFLGVPFLMIYNYGSQMLRSLGDSKRPLFILIISGIINVVFDLIFVILFKMDVKGVAYATVLSEIVSSILILAWFYYNKNGFVKLSLKELKISKKELIDILKIGIPAGIQGLAFSIPNVIIQSSLYTIHDYTINGIPIAEDEIISGAAASQQIESYIFAMLDAFAVGLVSFVGQNYGANNKINIKKCYWYSFAWMMIFWVISTIICAIFPHQLLSIFIKESDGVVLENALEAGKERLYIMAFTYFIDGWMDINSNYLRGMKVSTPPAIITMIGCSGTRILFLLTLFKVPYFHTIFWLYAVFPISWILVNIVYLPVILYYEKKTFKQLDEYTLKEAFSN